MSNASAKDSARFLAMIRARIEGGGFKVHNPPRYHQPKKYPWRVEGPDGSCWAVRATEREALVRADEYVRVASLKGRR